MIQQLTSNTQFNFLSAEIAVVSLIFVLILLVKSLIDYSRTGPQIKEEIAKNYFLYTIYAITRLSFYAYITIYLVLLTGKSIFDATTVIFSLEYNHFFALFVSVCFSFLVVLYQFCKNLLYSPSMVIASWQYNIKRLYPIWNFLSPTKITITLYFFTFLFFSSMFFAAFMSLAQKQYSNSIYFGAITCLAILAAFITKQKKITPRRANQDNTQPNVIMIGTDTLRVDHLGAFGYKRATSPFIDTLASKSYCLSNCYVPLARTAPSLACLHTGLLPNKLKIFDNFVSTEQAQIPQLTLPRYFKEHGYETLAISDWSGSDLKKYDFGYDQVDAPNDQWNIKYYLRQGPMPLRLFLSLFYNNRIGKHCLPEIYYQAGNPLTKHLTNKCLDSINKLSQSDKPFFLNLFMGTTHAPFGSEYPHYLKFTDRDYSDNSKFVMFSYTDPNDIIQQQEKDKDAFDFQQIINLYDGCVANFDAAVKSIYEHLEATGIKDNTIIVIYSDHGTDFFEYGVWGQGNTLIGRDHSARIPVIIHTPDIAEGKVIDQITRLTDIAPTLYELCGFEVPKTNGVSLKQVLDNPYLNLNLSAYQETGIWLSKMPGMDPEHQTYPNLLELLEIPDLNKGTLSIKASFLPIIEEAKDRMVRKGKWKLIRTPLVNSIKYELFDMEADPDCQDNVAEKYPDIIESLKIELKKYSPCWN